jgi:hypothetical protein
MRAAAASRVALGALFWTALLAGGLATGGLVAACARFLSSLAL